MRELKKQNKTKSHKKRNSCSPMTIMPRAINLYETLTNSYLIDIPCFLSFFR